MLRSDDAIEQIVARLIAERNRLDAGIQPLYRAASMKSA